MVFARDIKVHLWARGTGPGKACHGKKKPRKRTLEILLQGPRSEADGWGRLMCDACEKYWQDQNK